MGDGQHAHVIDGGDGPAQQDWRDVGKDPVDHTGPQKRAGQRRATLQQHVGAIRQRLDHLVRITGADHHRARVVVENSCLRGYFAFTNDDAQRLTLGQGAVGQTGRQRRVVDEHRSGADDYRVRRGTAAMHVGPRGLAGDPLAGAVGGGAAAVDAGRELPRDVRQSRCAACAAIPGADHPRRCRPTPRPRPSIPDSASRRGAACGFRIGIGDGVRHPRNPGRDKRIHARRGPAVVVARLQRHDRGAADSALPRPAQRHDLGVRAAGRLRCADAGDLAVAVQNDRTHRRIGIGAALDPIGLLDGQPHRGVEIHSRRCLDAEAACRRSDSTAAAGSSAL